MIQAEVPKKYITNKFGESLYLEYKNSPDVAADFKQQIQDEVFLSMVGDWIQFCKGVQPGTISDLCSKLYKERDDLSIYAGCGGYLLVYVKMYKFFAELSPAQRVHYTNLLHTDKQLTDEQQKYFLDGQSYLDMATKQLKAMDKLLEKDTQISYYMSSAPIFVMGAEIALFKNDQNAYFACVTAVYNIIQRVKTSKQDSLVYEVLYGLPGFIYCLLQLQQVTKGKEGNFDSDLQKHIFAFCEQTLEQGINAAGLNYKKLLSDQHNLPPGFRLVYTFHKTEYLGGAHGLFGVLQILLLAYKENQQFFDQLQLVAVTILMMKCIKASFDFVLGLQLPSGSNFPSSMKKVQQQQQLPQQGANATQTGDPPRDDSLQQFCHGAPGAVAPLLLAAEQSPSATFHDAALKATLSIWTYGLLKKGAGICHGIPGNAYPFLSMYRVTQDLLFYQYAWRFVLYKKDARVMEAVREYDHPGRYKVGCTDNPYSLMLGLAGDIVAQLDFLQEGKHGFPGYEL